MAQLSIKLTLPIINYRFSYTHTGSIIATFMIQSEASSMTSIIDDIQSNIISGYYLIFEGTTIHAHHSLFIDGKVYKSPSVSRL